MVRKPRELTAILAVAGLWLSAAPVGAVVTLSASRAEVLYSADANPDCRELHATLDPALPFNVVRLTVLVDGQPPPAGSQIHWSFPDPATGTLTADQNLEPTDQTSGIVGFCTQFGNECVITKEKLKFYTESSILWLGPTCSELPDKTSRQFPGDNVTFRVKVTQGGRKLGKARVVVGYGHLGSAKLFVNGDDALGKPNGPVNGFKVTFAGAADFGGNPLPPIETFRFDSGGGESANVVPPCQLTAPLEADACVVLAYPGPARYVPVLTVELADGSALCDKLTYRVAACDGRPELEILTSPRGPTFKSGQQVRLRARLHNRSPREGGCGFSLSGADVLTCSAELKIGGIEDSRTGSVDFQHCSVTASQPCESDADCQCTETECLCQDCEPNEFCITYSYCSKTVARRCTSDQSCRAPACPECRDDESCVNVLPFSVKSLDVGESVDLLDTVVELKNVLPDTASMKETWTARTENAGSDSDELKYKIRGTR